MIIWGTVGIKGVRGQQPYSGTFLNNVQSVLKDPKISPMSIYHHQPEPLIQGCTFIVLKSNYESQLIRPGNIVQAWRVSAKCPVPS